MSSQIQYVQFGKYLLLDRIAVGGMSEVYRAKFFGAERFEKILAIKKLLPNIAEDEEFVEMFINEAKLASQLTHSNICQIYDLGKIDGNLFIAMEYIWGKDLLQIINYFRKRRDFMPPPMASYIATRVCEGIDYAYHKRGPQGMPLKIIHRDVSPQNILISYDGEIKIIDFGIAKATLHHSETQAGLLKGKFSYMSPEQVQGFPIDHRSDIFAIGTVLFEMLTSMSLFKGENDFMTLEKVRKAEVPKLTDINPRVPKSLEKIVMKALALDPKDRWQRAADFQDALQRFLITSPPIYTAKRLADWMRVTFKEDIDSDKFRMEEYSKIGPEVLRKSMPPSQPPPKPQTAERKSPVSAKRTLLGMGPPPVSADKLPEREQVVPSVTVPRPGEVVPPPVMPPLSTDKKMPPPMPQDKQRPMKTPPLPPPLVSARTSKPPPVPRVPPPVLPVTPAVTAGSDVPVQFPEATGGMSPSTDVPVEVPQSANIVQSEQVLGGNQVISQNVTQQAVDYEEEEKQKIVAIPKQDGKGITTTTFKTAEGVEFEEDEEPTRALDEEAQSVDDAIKIDTSGLRDTGEPVFVEGGRKRKDTLGAGISQTDMGQVTPPGAAAYPVSPEMMAALGQGTVAIGPDGKPVFVPLIPQKQGFLSPAMKWVLVMAITMVVMMIGGVVMYVLMTQTKVKTAGQGITGQAKLSENEGALLLRIFPSTANVKVNGKVIPSEKLSSPIVVPANIPFDVEIWQEGYKREKFPLMIPPGNTITKEVALQELRGRVIVNSVPDKAEVYVGGQLKGETPASIEDFPINERITVTVKKKDFEVWSEVVELSEEKTERTLVAILQKESKKGKELLPVIASQTESPVSSDEEKTGKQKASVATGKKGKDVKKEKEVSTPTTGSGKKGSSTGSEGYFIALTKPWAKVLIDGKDTGRKTPIVPTNPIKLSAGSHKVTFVLPDGQSYNFNIKINPGEQTKLIKNFE